MNILYCQFSSEFLNKDIPKDISSEYYQGIYKYKVIHGYYKHKDFWEVPLWIAEADYLLKDYQSELHIIRHISDTIDYINNSNIDFILFSVLDINKDYIHTIIKNCTNKKFIIGGYTDFSIFKDLKNCTVLNSIKDLASFFDIVYTYGTNYKLFKDIKIIPRLNLSNGCTNKCSFCTIPKNITMYSDTDIYNQVNSFKDLKFKLIYINDKTYGQAKNYNILKELYPIIKAYNKNFTGFIIQSTCIQILKKDFINELKKLHIEVIELGIETYNNTILKDLNKPSNTIIIDKCMNLLIKNKFKIITNIIIGLPNESKKTYRNTLNFIKKYKKHIFLMNIYNLAIYRGTMLYNTIKDKNNNTNELIVNTNRIVITFYKNIFKLGLYILKTEV